MSRCPSCGASDRNTTFVGIAGLLLLCVGVFGFMNVCDYSRPPVPSLSTLSPKEERDERMARYREDMARVGQWAVMSRNAALAASVFGFVGAIGCMFVVVLSE